jgi:hypothetical protein
MQPEQPQQTPSPDVQPSDAAAGESTSDEQREGSSPGWWQRLFSRRPTEEPQADSGESKDTSGASQTLRLTEEELQKRIQSEADRREMKRAQEARKQERLQLRDKDPWAYAEQERQEEQAQQATSAQQGFFSNVGTAHDRVSIDPVINSLPKGELERIMKLDGAGTGLEGRKLVVTESLKALEKHWKAEGAREAESKLRRNQAFRKQVLTEGRVTAVDPELLPGAASSNGSDRDVSALLRTHYRVG